MNWLDRPWVRTAGALCPNTSSREGSSIDAIFLHYTAGGSTEGAVSWFQNPTAKASAHFVVGRSGEIVQVVPLSERAWHAGQGRFPIDGKEVQVAIDRSSVGIEIVNHGLLSFHDGKFFTHLGERELPYNDTKFGKPVKARLDFIDNKRSPDVEGWWAPYPQEQLEAVVKLCEALVEEFNIPLQRIVGHEDVAYPQGRKTDPGPLWPWPLFMARLAGSKHQGKLPDDIWALHKTRR